MSFHENEPILDGRGNHLMPAMPIFQKQCFFKKSPKNLTNFGKFKIFLHFLLQFYGAFQWYIVCFHTLSGLGCTDQNLNQEIGDIHHNSFSDCACEAGTFYVVRDNVFCIAFAKLLPCPGCYLEKYIKLCFLVLLTLCNRFHFLILQLQHKHHWEICNN